MIRHLFSTQHDINLKQDDQLDLNKTNNTSKEETSSYVKDTTTDEKKPNIEIKWDVTEDLPEIVDNGIKAIEKSTNDITWQLFDELPDLEAVTPMDINETINQLLSSSNEKITKVLQYVKDNNIESIPLKNVDLYSMQQYFNKDNIAYPLNEDHAYAIENILGDLTDPIVINKSLERDILKISKLYDKVTSILEEQQEKLAIIKDLSPTLTAKLITKTVSYLYTKKIQQLYQNKTSLAITDIIFPTNSTAIAIGNSLIEAYAYKNILYHKDTACIVIATSKYKKVIEHVRITNEQIKEIIKDFKTLAITNNNNNNLTEIIGNYLLLYADEHKIVALNEDKRTELQTKMQRAAQNIGYAMLF